MQQQQQQPVTRAAVLLLWTMLLSAFTAILSAAPLRVFRLTVGNGFYWSVMAAVLSSLVLLGWVPLAVVLGAQTLLIGVYSELEERDFTLRQTTTLTVFLTGLVLSSVFYTWAVVTGKDWLQKVTSGVELILARAADLKLNFVSHIQASDIVFQIPSGVIVFLIISLAVSLMLEKLFLRWAGVKSIRTERLSDYNAPDAFIWLFIFSLLGAFAEHHVRWIEVVSINILNVMATAYFFQGLAVLFKYFESFKVGFFWRALWVLLVVVQLPILMGLLGVVDYWANFRRVIVKRATDLKKRRIQE